MKLTCNNQICVIYCSKSFGPRFCGNSDILITGNHINCFSEIPSSFGVNEGVHPYFLTDRHKFDVKKVNFSCGIYLILTGILSKKLKLKVKIFFYWKIFYLEIIFIFIIF